MLARLSDQLAEKVSSVVLLTGSPGIGKTTAIRLFVDIRGGKDPAQPICLLKESVRQDGPSALSLMLAGQMCPRMLIVDDAASLTERQKGQVLRLGQSAPSGSGPMSVVLVGDDSLRGSFVDCGDAGPPPALREISLAPLKIGEVEHYLRHRLVTARCMNPEDLLPFDGDAVELLFELSQGVPRFVDHFAERALHEAARDGRAVASGDLVRASLLDGSDLEIGWPPPPVTTWKKPPASATEARSAPDGAALTMPQAGAGRLHADRGTAILPLPRRRRGAVIMPLVMSGAGLAGAAWFLAGSPFLQPEAPEPDRPALMEAALLPHLSEDMPGLSAAPVRIIPQPALGPPSGVDVDPDPVQLLADGLAAGADRPADAAVAYEVAALWGNGRAAYFVGQLFETGLGVPFDLPRAQAWYSVATGIPGAESRLASLADLPAPQEDATSAPLPLRHRLFRSGRTVLHWRNAPGQSPQRYIVEYVLAGEQGRVRQAQTTLSAMLLSRPVIRWRVISVNGQGQESDASAWSSVIPPPR